MQVHPRHTTFIDKRVQGALARRVAAYWVLCLVGVFVLLLAFQAVLVSTFQFENAPTYWQLFARTWAMLWPAMVASLIPMPIVMWDVVRLSNRFVGPMYRLRKAMQDATAGEPVATLRFREGDFWYEFAEDFNRLLEVRRLPAGAAVDEVDEMVQSAVNAMRQADELPVVCLEEEEAESFRA